MKTRKYKFDALWLEALSMSDDYNVAYVEKEIRQYIENGKNIEGMFFGSDLRGAWVLIKAEIDRRKSRNERARERRRMRREAIENERREAEEARLRQERMAQEAAAKALADAAEAQAAERRRKAEARRNRNIIRRSSVNSKPASPSSSGSSAPATIRKPKFSDRFRGPGNPLSHGIAPHSPTR